MFHTAHTFHTFSFHSLFANAILKYFTWFRCDWCRCVRLRAVQTLRARWLGQQRVSDPNGRRPGEQKRRTEAAWLRNFTNLFCIWTVQPLRKAFGNHIWFWDTDWFGKYLERLAWCAWWSNFCSFCQCVYSSDLGPKNHQVALKRKNVRRKGSLVVWSRLVTFGHFWSRLVTFGHVFKETRDPATRSNLERVYFSNWHTSMGLCLDHPWSQLIWLLWWLCYFVSHDSCFFFRPIVIIVRPSAYAQHDQHVCKCLKYLKSATRFHLWFNFRSKIEQDPISAVPL